MLVIFGNILVSYHGVSVEGIRLAQYPCCVAEVLIAISWLGIRRFDLMALSLTLMSILAFYLYGEGSLSRLGEPKGPYAVGFKRIWSSNGQLVLCFYPIKHENWASLWESEKPLMLNFGARCLEPL